MMVSKIGANIPAFTGIEKQQKTVSKSYSSANLRLLSKDTVNFSSKIAFKGEKAEAPELIERLHNYIGKLKNLIQGNIVVVSGPSGVGKDTVIGLMQKQSPNLNSILSYTTRAPREGEIDGVNYKFLKGKGRHKYFERLIKENKLFQYFHNKDNGEYYGITKTDLEKSRKGHDVVVNVTADEAVRIKEKYGDKAVTVFVDASSPEELEARLRARGTEKPGEIERRIASGKWQRSFAPQFDNIVINAKGKQNEAAQAMSDYINERKDPVLKTLEDVQSVLEEKYEFKGRVKQ